MSKSVNKIVTINRVTDELEKLSNLMMSYPQSRKAEIPNGRQVEPLLKMFTYTHP